MKYNLDNILCRRKTKEVIRDNDKVIKLFVENYSKANILNEALNQARVEENTNLNIPKLAEVSKIENRWALVSEFIDGKSLAELMENLPENFDKYLEKFVDIQLDVLSNSVPLLNRMKEKFARKISNLDIIDESTKYELLHKLEGMKNHTKLCHGDFNPSNIIIKEDGSYFIIDWAHVSQGNASGDAAKTYLLFVMDGKQEVADKYLQLFSQKSGIDLLNIQKWIPIVAASQLEKCAEEEKEFLLKCVNVVEYQ